MQWIGETIEAPISGSLDAGLDQAGDIGGAFAGDLLHVLQTMQDGDFSVRISEQQDGLSGKIAKAVNAIAAANQRMTQQLERVGEEVGREGRTRQRIKLGQPGGGWGEMEDQINRIRDAAAVWKETAAELGRRIAEGAVELERSQQRLRDSEDHRKLALAAGQMGSWDWDVLDGRCLWDDGQKQIFGAPGSFEVVLAKVRALVDRGDWKMLCRQLKRARKNGGAYQLEFRVRRPDGGVRWCHGTAVAAKDAAGRVSHVRGVTMDITERKESEDRQLLLAREVDHRTKNALAVVHAIVSLTRADDIEQFNATVEGRIQALARAHSLLSESRWRGAKIAELILGELAPFRTAGPERVRISGRGLSLHPSAVQALALTVHELAANAARHGALSVPFGSVNIIWEQQGDELVLRWNECGGPAVEQHSREGFGMRIIRASVETQLSGVVEFNRRQDGLQCCIRVPRHPKSGLFGNFLYSIQPPGAAFEAAPRRSMAALS
jgi:PAS domain S-box-containing protein